MKQKIMILRKFGNKYHKLGEAKFKEDTELIKWKKHQIPLPPNNPYCFSTNKLNLIFFDIDKKQYINFEKTDLGLSTEFLDELFDRKIVGQLAKAIDRANKPDTSGMDFIKNAVIYGVCVLVGYLIGSGFLSGF